MKYLQILNRIRESTWLITPEGFDVVMGVINTHIVHGHLTETQIRERLAAADDDNDNPPQQLNNGIGVLPISGPIFGKANLLTKLSGATSLEMFQQDFKAMMIDDSISSIILQIDSPGGTSELVAETGEMIASADKPVYAIADSFACSAAYWLGSQAKAGLYTTRSGRVGSVGAYIAHVDQSQADHQRGFKYSFIQGGKYKTEGNPHQPLSAEARDYVQELVDECYHEFVDAVASGRNTTTEDVLENYGQGRVITPKRALETKMVDGITTFDGLVNHITNEQKPEPVRISMVIDGQTVAAIMRGNIIELEHKDLEHSEPGTGSPPIPRDDDDPDRAAEEGWRRERNPKDPDEPGAPKPNAGEDMEVTEQLLTALREQLGLAEDADENAILAALTVNPLPVGQLDSRDRAFAEEYPEIYREHMAMIERDRTNAAKAFVTNNRKYGHFGLSALAATTLEELHIKFAKSEGTLVDFESAVTAIMKDGLVDYSERGSSTPNDEPIEVDTDTSAGVRNARVTFHNHIKAIQTEKNCSFEVAMREAAEKYPDLAEAYRVSGAGTR